MSPPTISADGMTWPLEAYLDAMRFTRLDRWDEPRLDPQVRIVTVSRDLRLSDARYVSEVVHWGDVLAYRHIDHSPAAAACRTCGDPLGRLDGGDVCAGCEDAAEYGW